MTEAQTMTHEELEQLVESIGKSILKDVDSTVEKANALLSQYGLSCKMQIVIDELPNLNKAHDTMKSE